MTEMNASQSLEHVELEQFVKDISTIDVQIGYITETLPNEETIKHTNVTPTVTKTALGSRRVILSSLIAFLASLSFGMSIAYSSPAIPNINSHPNPFRVTQEMHSWFASISFIGALISAIIAVTLGDRLGRKTLLMLAPVPAACGWVTIVSSQSSITLIVGRIFLGVAGLLYSLAPSIYVIEISPPHTRGKLMTIGTFLVNIGILIVYICGTYIAWNWLAIACFIPPVLLTLLMIPLPESPRWLLLHNRVLEASQALAWFRGTTEKNIQPELLQMQAGLKSVANSQSVSWRMFLRQPLLKYMLINFGLIVLTVLSGSNIVVAYTVTIFQSAGSDLDPYSQTILIGVVMVAGSVLCGFVIDRFPRRVLLMFSGIVMTAGWLTMGIYFLVLKMGLVFAVQYLFWIPILSLIVIVSGSNLGFSTIPGLISKEMFSTIYRGRVSSLSLLSACMISFLNTKYFLSLGVLIGTFGTFFCFALICFAGVVFIYFLLPETKENNLDAPITTKN